MRKSFDGYGIGRDFGGTHLRASGSGTITGAGADGDTTSVFSWIDPGENRKGSFGQPGASVTNRKEGHRFTKGVIRLNGRT